MNGWMHAPEDITITVTATEVELFWSPVPGATSYKVYSSDDPYSNFTEDTTGTFVGESWSTPSSGEKNSIMWWQ